MSQPAIITLAVDKANNGTTTDVEFRSFDSTSTKSTYESATSTVVARDQLALYRTFAKRNGIFLGSTKTTAKFTQDITVTNAEGTGDVKVPLIVEINFSVPVGATPAQTEEVRQRALALLDRTDLMSNLNDRGEI